MSGQDKTYHSLKDFGNAYYNEHPEFQIIRLLLSYGVDIPVEDLDNIEIIEITGKKITYLDKRTNEVNTSNLEANMPEIFKSRNNVLLRTSNKDETSFVEQFNSIRQANTFEQAGKYALESRSNPQTTVLSRAYRDINTKYGDFCLEVEESPRKNIYGHYKLVSLYHGNHEQLLDESSNEFDLPNNGIFYWDYINNDNVFDQCMLGFTGNPFSNPFSNVWRYRKSNAFGREVDVPIFASYNRKDMMSGAIFPKGYLRVDENLRYLPDVFEHQDFRNQIRDYENGNYTAKAYFANYKECCAVVKKGTTITIECKRKDYKNINWKKTFSMNIESKTPHLFSYDDIQKIIIGAESLPISDELKKHLKNQFVAYMNTQEENNINTLKVPSLEQYDFETMVDFINRPDIAEIVEKALETLSSIFNLPVDEIVGQNIKEKDSPQVLAKTTQSKRNPEE